jgi:hypothetical protein
LILTHSGTLNEFGRPKKNDYCKLVAPPKEGPGFHAIARSTQILARKEEPEGRTGRDGSRVETLGRLAPNETNLWLRSEKTREWTYAAFREIGRP